MNTNDKSDKQEISRRKFLQIGGTILAGGVLTGSMGYLLKNIKKPAGSSQIPQKKLETPVFKSPYKLVGAFRTPAQIESFDFYKGKVIIATLREIGIYETNGNQISHFTVGSNLRDIVAENDLIYLLYSSRIEVYDFTGNLKTKWEACEENSDYCSMAVSEHHVFVTDTSNKNICQYTLQGDLVRFIESPNRFIIPSYSFGITYAGNKIYCSNPGRHCVEQYSSEGEFLGSFGEPGDAPGRFCGCCNPVHLSFTANGEIITSEKGKPRISCYDSEGHFRNVLLNTEMLGGGNTAYDIKIHEDKIWIAGSNMVSTFQFDKRMALESSCSDCGVICPLKA